MSGQVTYEYNTIQYNTIHITKTILVKSDQTIHTLRSHTMDSSVALTRTKRRIRAGVEGHAAWREREDEDYAGKGKRA